MTARYEVGKVTHDLPDCGSGRIIRVEPGVEFGEDVTYVTIVNSLGQEITRWVR